MWTFLGCFHASSWLTLCLAIFDLSGLYFESRAICVCFKVRLKHSSCTGWFCQCYYSYFIMCGPLPPRSPRGRRTHMLVSKVKPHTEKHIAMHWFVLLPWSMWHCCCLLLLPSAACCSLTTLGDNLQQCHVECVFSKPHPGLSCL